MHEESFSGGLRSPAGFVFGVQGWMWGPPRPTSITFFIDGTAKVSDQYGRPIRGAVIDNKEIRFATEPPPADENGIGSGRSVRVSARKGLATHAQVIAALEAEKIDWQTLTYAGFPQLPYADLKRVKQIPPTPIDELIHIPNPVLRRDAVRLRKEMNAVIEKELEEAGILLGEE